MRWDLSCAALAALLFATSEVRAQSACAQSYEQAQYAKKAKRYREARKHLLICSQPTCNQALVTDCIGWLQEVDKATSTVVVGAKDGAGADLTDVTVTMDGEVLTQKLDGSAINVESGEHSFKFERQGVSSEQKLLIREGEKSRLVEVTLAPAAAPPVEKPKEADTGSTSLVPVYVLAGVGGTALLTGTILGITVLTGKSDCEDKKAAGAPCSRGDVSSLELRRTLTDVFLGVGIVSLGVAGVLYFTRDQPKATAPIAAARLAPIGGVSANGGFVGLSGSF